MRTWKTIAGGLLGGGLLFIAACEREQKASPPPPPDPVTVCHDECRDNKEKMLQECRERLTAEGAFDRLIDCSVEADEYAKKCDDECDQKFAAQ